MFEKTELKREQIVVEKQTTETELTSSDAKVEDVALASGRIQQESDKIILQRAESSDKSVKPTVPESEYDIAVPGP